MKGLFIIIGESFRLSKPPKEFNKWQRNYTLGTEESHNMQIQASRSHVHFFRFLKKKYNINSDICINTYTTQYDNDIREVYKDYGIHYNFYKFGKFGKHVDPAAKLQVRDSLRKISNGGKYLFVFILRIDIFLKPLMQKYFNPFVKKITWPSICWVPDETVKKKNKEGNIIDTKIPRVNDMFIFIPKKFYRQLDILTRYIQHHNTWYQYLRYTLLHNGQMSTFLDTYHDSDSGKDWNPLYFIVNRKRSKIWKSTIWKFNKKTFKKEKMTKQEVDQIFIDYKYIELN